MSAGLGCGTCQQAPLRIGAQNSRAPTTRPSREVTTLRAPFPYFGGKSAIAEYVWSRLGNPKTYIEPFFGSGAMLLARPHPPQIEIANDVCDFLSNFWRAVKFAPEEVAEWADWPVLECDLHARHYWLITEGRARLARIMGDPMAYDAQVAGWWVWGISAWIGSGWCAERSGPWAWQDGEWVKGDVVGAAKKSPHLGGPATKGIHPGDGGVKRQRPHLKEGGGSGVSSKRDLLRWFADLSARLRYVRVCCGDFQRVLGDTPTGNGQGTCAVFLDPPYAARDRDMGVYQHDAAEVAHRARAWAIAHGDEKRFRIAFCGYDGEWETPWPDGWQEWAWKANGGMGNQSADGRGRENASRERVWFSPHCLPEQSLQLAMF